MSTTSAQGSPPRYGLAAPAGAPQVNPARRGPIILATDGTDRSGAPVTAARMVAERLDLPLEVVTVLEPQVVPGVALGGVPIYLDAVEDSRRLRRTTAVRDYVARFSGGAAPTSVHVRYGAIADEIASVARERAASLIVLGAAPHERLRRVIGGERAVHVLRASSVPVLSVPPGFETLPRNVVVGVDFSPASVRAAQAALLLLGDGGTLTLLHVVSPLMADAPLRDASGRDPSNTVQALFERLRNELRPYVPGGVTVETSVRTDADVDGVIAGATRAGADLIAVGTHGPRLLERMFVGSVASSVLHVAPQAVLAAPPPPAAEALALWLRITGTATSSYPREWGVALDAFSRRNVGRGATIEVDDPELGAQLLGHGSLSGVTYDPHDKRVEIMVGDGGAAHRHFTHTIPKVESIGMTVDDGSTREVLELRHGGGHTLVLVVP